MQFSLIQKRTFKFSWSLLNCGHFLSVKSLNKNGTGKFLTFTFSQETKRYRIGRILF